MIFHIKNFLRGLGIFFKEDWEHWQEMVELEQDIKVNTLDENELATLLAKKLGVLDDIDDEYEKKIFKDLKGTDGLVAYLREAAARDVQRYFGAASIQEQSIIRGSFARTMYLKTKIENSDKE